jgi:hypothetical protein
VPGEDEEGIVRELKRREKVRRLSQVRILWWIKWRLSGCTLLELPRQDKIGSQQATFKAGSGKTPLGIFRADIVS